MTTSTKLKVLIVGGESKHVSDDILAALDFHHIKPSAKSISNQICPDAKAIIVISKFVSAKLANSAKKLAKLRKIQFVSAKNWNYIIDELVKYRLAEKPVLGALVESMPGRVITEDAPTVSDVAVAASPSKPVSTEPVPTGLSPEDLWDKYGQKSIDTLQSALKPGEKIAEDDLLALFQVEGGVGLPAVDAIELLPELSMRGVILNVRGKTWRMAKATMMDDGEDLDTPEDNDEVAAVLKEPSLPKPKPPANEKKGALYWATLLGRLPEGPYNGVYRIWGVARTYKEFSRADGVALAASYGRNVIPVAMELGIVVQDGSTYRIRHVDDGPLTVREGADPDHPWAGRLNTKNSGANSIQKQPDDSQKIKPKSDDDIVAVVNKHFGGSIPTIDRYTLPTKVLKKMIPAKYWETLWAQCIARIVNIGRHDNALKLKDKFSQMELDRMAYEVLGKLPVEVLIQFLKDEPKDQELTCMDCADKFIVSIQEWKYLQDKFKDEAALPKRCQKCRDARK